jgi:hypothetical protein
MSYYEFKLVTYKKYNNSVHRTFRLGEYEGILCDQCGRPSKFALVKIDQLNKGSINAGIYNDYCSEACYNMHLIRYAL